MHRFSSYLVLIRKLFFFYLKNTYSAHSIHIYYICIRQIIHIRLYPYCTEWYQTLGNRETMAHSLMKYFSEVTPARHLKECVDICHC